MALNALSHSDLLYVDAVTRRVEQAVPLVHAREHFTFAALFFVGCMPRGREGRQLC